MQPELLEALEAIDATLAGDAVDPRHAELAELALLLRSERPEVSLAFGAELDRRVRERFAPRPAAKVRRTRRAWLFAPAAGVGAAVAVAVAIVVSEPPSSPRLNSVNDAVASVAAKSVPAAGHTAAAAIRAAGSVSSAVSNSSAAAVKAAAPAPLVPGTPTGFASSSAGAVLAPAPNGRRIVQGGQLSLSTAPSRVDTVAQEVFQVAGRENAIVQSSNVTATQGPGGYAQFELNIPSGSLAQTMAALSALPYARVSSRTDTTQDVNNQYLDDVRALSDARALRTALLKQLAGAVTQAQIDSLTARIHDADASISSDEATIGALNHQINFSRVTVTINAGAAPVPVTHSSGFTLSKALHDAGKVLTVAAGVALIGLAAMVPVGLLLALGWWVRALVVRRRREQALDLV